MTPPDDPAAVDERTGDGEGHERAPVTPVVDVPQAPDPILQNLAFIGNAVGVPLSLYLPWGVASGRIAPPGEYYQHLAEHVRSAPEGAPPSFTELLDFVAKRWFDPFVDMPQAELYKDSFRDGFNLISFVVLKDANCKINSGPPVQHEFLRIKLADVTAWSWGKLEWGG
ncbi:hypothetical protein JF770_25735 [Mycobacterium intracellulare]|uniref:hypothetical protein n=1 Tax=Mycobacterium intracellulare TaxID=1767 RepID=UPI00109EABF0|nr:hypothetical protein [Mycobacterium intracellulare]MCA2306968.1 hypothetical protein [Mycobacterium intracellulare]MCA2349220.1 hypothetical protein [Mycobacterium intracellulare]